jgi:DNA polymerase-3 subunit delta
VRERAGAAGLDLAPEAAQLLVTLVGEDLGRLAGEIDKAQVFAGGKGRLDEETVRALVGESRVRQYWELTQALEGADRAEALRVLECLLESGEEPLALLAQVVGYLRDVWRAQAALAQRMDTRRAAALLPRRRPDWAVERLLARAATWGPARLDRSLARCVEVEVRLKSGGGEPRALLTALVADLATL